MAKRYHSDKKMMKKMGGMISEDHSATALLPTHVMQKEYGKREYPMKGYMDDLYKGVTRQLDEDARDMKKLTKPSKY